MHLQWVLFLHLEEVHWQEYWTRGLVHTTSIKRWFTSLNFSLFCLFFFAAVSFELHLDIIFSLFFRTFIICVFPHSNWLASLLVLVPLWQNCWITSIFSLNVRHFLFPRVSANLGENFFLSCTDEDLLLVGSLNIRAWPFLSSSSVFLNPGKH